MPKSSRAWPTGSMVRFIATMKRSSELVPMSLRSSVVVAGSTMSAWRAVAVHHGSLTIMVSGRRQARTSRFRSWWAWNGLPPHQYTSRMSG